MIFFVIILFCDQNSRIRLYILENIKNITLSATVCSYQEDKFWRSRFLGEIYREICKSLEVLELEFGDKHSVCSEKIKSDWDGK